MSFNTDVRNQQEMVEYQKFVEIKDDSRFPPLTVVNQRILDNGSVNTSTTTYPKFAVLTYNAGGSFTKCETKTSGNPSFIPAQIYIHNTTNFAKNVELTLISGMSCIIAMGQQNSPNHALTLNLAVSGVTNYDSCSITYFA